MNNIEGLSHPNYDRALFVTEVGSRMWGMAELSSDHDMFVCYQTPASVYLRTGNFIPTRPAMPHVTIGKEEYDFQYMEIGHLVNLLAKGNINAIWAVFSPIIHKNSYYLPLLRQLVEITLSKETYYSINGMAVSQLSDARKRVDARPPEKSLKTCVRTIDFGCRLLLGAGIVFSPITVDVTEEDCRQQFLRLEKAHEESRLPDKSAPAGFREFLFTLRMHEILENEVRVGMK
jgi:hypothetical protein